MCVESMALQTAAAPKLPGNLQTCVDELGVACVEQPGSGDSAVVFVACYRADMVRQCLRWTVTCH